MPWTEKQHNTFEAIAHGWKPKKGSLKSISKDKAAKMAAEGIKAKSAGQAKALENV